MYSVKKVRAEGFNVLSKKPTGPRDEYIVVDENGDESWVCTTSVAAQMYAACKNRDEAEGTHFEAELNEFLNAERWEAEDEYMYGHTEASNGIRQG